MYTQEQINKIVNIKDGIGQSIDIFNLRAIITLTDSKKETGFHTLTSEYIAFNLEDFEDCKTDQEVEDTFRDILEDVIRENLTKNL